MCQHTSNVKFVKEAVPILVKSKYGPKTRPFNIKNLCCFYSIAMYRMHNYYIGYLSIMSLAMRRKAKDSSVLSAVLTG